MRFFGKLMLFAVVIAVAAGSWVLAGQSGPTERQAGTVIKDQKQIYQRLMAYEPRSYFDDYGVMRIYDTIKNVSPDDCVYVKLSIEVRDKKNKLLNTLDVTVNEIDAGESKAFDINGGTKIEGISLATKITEAGFSKR